MTYNEALLEIENNKNLIGKVYKGAIIEELAIVPTDSKQFDQFLKNYIRTLNAIQSIVPFIANDVDIFAFFEKKYIKQGYFPYTSLKEIKKHFANNK